MQKKGRQNRRSVDHLSPELKQAFAEYQRCHPLAGESAFKAVSQGPKPKRARGVIRG